MIFIELSLPTSLLKSLWNPITKFLFLESYQISHEMYWKRNQLGKRFTKLGMFFEYDIHLQCKYLSNSEIPVSSILIRNKSEENFKKIELIVEVSRRTIKFFDSAILFDVDNVPIIVKLPKIPLREITFDKDSNFFFTYNSYKVKINAYDEDSNSYKEIGKSTMHLTHTEIINSEWCRKWDCVWNIDYIERNKTMFRSKLRNYFISRNEWPCANEPKNIFYQKYKMIRLIIGRPIYKVLSEKRVLAILFWLPIFLRIRKLELSENLNF